MIMRRPRLAETILLLVLAGPAAAQQTPYTIGKHAWIEAHYPQAYPPLIDWRRAPYGRTADVDYMLGTSACRIDGRRVWGSRVLNYILYSYSLSTDSRAKVTGERDRCRAAGVVPPMTLAARSGLDKIVAAGATARGKMFSFDGDKSIAAYAARQTRPIARADLDRRLVPVGKAATIESMLKVLVPTARVKVIGRYAFVVGAGQTDAQLGAIAASLDRYIAFLGREYGIEPPDRYLTLYLMPSIGRVQAIADKVHGLDVSPSTLGYAYQDDLSTVAMIQGTSTGTLFHELFHLLVRSSFGDIPQWLDEGMAGLYEVSIYRDGKQRGLPNWRGRVLRDGGDRRPPLSGVVDSPWFAYDMTGRQPGLFVMPQETAALNLATARYFALYLQEKGKLTDVYRAFRDRDPGDAADPAAQAVAIITQTVAPLDTLQPDYDRWLRTVIGQDATTQPGAGTNTVPDRPADPKATGA